MPWSGCSRVAEIEMPRLSDSMEEGTILKWLKSAGEEVARGEALVEIETDKATMTYESSAAGRLEIVAAEGDTLPIGAVIARIGVVADGSEADRGSAASPGQPGATGEPGAASGSASAPAGAVVPSRRARRPRFRARRRPSPRRPRSSPSAVELADREPGLEPVPDAEPVEPSAPPDERVRASPIARRIARERGVDLASVKGSGPAGRVVRVDVERRRGRPAGQHGGGGAGRGPRRRDPSLRSRPSIPRVRAPGLRARGTSRPRSRPGPSRSSPGGWPRRRRRCRSSP